MPVRFYWDFDRLFNASSIAAYGGDKFPRESAPEDSSKLPSTIYGISKIYGELLGAYYNSKFGLDYRSLRYPVILSSQEYGYKGTAIYTTEMFFKAIHDKKYECYVNAETKVPAIHVDDCVDATVNMLYH
jgi:threonine 3-dehydrogenase